MIGMRIKTYIIHKGLKLSVVAERAGISLPIFSAMVNEKRKISIEEYARICGALEVPLETFVPPST